jgi:hypothetical protein
MTARDKRPPAGPLSGPYAAAVGPGPLAPSAAVDDLVAAQVNALLSSSAVWHELTPAGRDEMRRNLQKISAYTASLVQEDFALSKRIGQTPVLRKTSLPDDAPLARAAAEGDRTSTSVTRRDKDGNETRSVTVTGPSSDEFAGRAVSRVGGVTRDTLNAIAFPTFVADLIKGTFNAIVDASIQQMEAFGTLLTNVAKTVDQFMSDNITDNQARDWLAAQYPQHFQVEISKGGEDGGGAGAGRGARGGARGGGARSGGARGGAGRGGGSPGGPGARMKVRPEAEGKPNFRRDLNLPKDVDLDDKSAEEVLVPAARRRLAQQRHQLLSTMILMGINRIVVTSGRIYARMGFHIDASDTAQADSASQYDYKKETTEGGGFLFYSAESKKSVAYVSSSKKGSSDAINVEADLTGEVDLKFKSETFPLERFADMNAITQIQGNTANPAANSPQAAVAEPPAGAKP